MCEFEICRDEEGCINCCECCGWDAATSLFDKPIHLISEVGRKRTVSDPKLREDQFRYCEVCANTLIASAHSYPRQHLDDGHILRCLAQCTNMILEALRR